MSNLVDISKTTNIKDLVFPEINSPDIVNTFHQIVETMPEHGQMIEVIKDNLPEIYRGSSLFFKTQSQFMDNMLTVSANTPIRNLRQILAEINRIREAIKENTIKLKKEEIEARIKQRDLSQMEDDLKAELLQVEILEALSKAETTRGYLSGAIRKLTNHIEQYNSIVNEFGLQNYNEEDFEKEEERYHIMKAFEQGLCASRSRGGLIDEGNMIYLTQIGINGSSAQKDVFEYLQQEGQLIQAKKEPSYAMYIGFLNKMADKYEGCATSYAKNKGMTLRSDIALLQEGNTKLLQLKEVK